MRRPSSGPADSWTNEIQQRAARFRRCPRPDFEVMLTAILGGLLQEARIPPGVVLDAGAHRGRWSCYYAATDEARRVIAMDPDADNVAIIRKEYPHMANLVPTVGALSSKSSVSAVKWASGRHEIRLYPKRKGQFNSSSATFSIYSIDDLFGPSVNLTDCANGQAPPCGVHLADEGLGLLHLDLEGGEMAALEGGRAAIRRYLPVIVTELMVHFRPNVSRAQVAELRSLDYDVYLIEEICGMRADIRNLLSLPRSRAGNFINSNILDLAVSTGYLVAVEENTILEHAFPCCELGGECCPMRDGRAQHCCAHFQVQYWLNNTLSNAAHDVRGMPRASWYDQRFTRFRPHAELMALQAMDRTRARQRNWTGLSYYTWPKKWLKKHAASVAGWRSKQIDEQPSSRDAF